MPRCGRPLLTWVANDFGCAPEFARQVDGLGRRGDTLMVFSTSGNSANLVAELMAARQQGLNTISLPGKSGGNCRGAGRPRY